MQRDDGVTWSKPGQFTVGLGHLRLDNVNDVFPYRNILDVERFEVQTSHAFANKIDFSDQIGDLIPHHTTGTHVRVDEQGTRRGTEQRFEGLLQVDQTPTAKNAEHEESLIDFPKERIFISIRQVGAGSGQRCNEIVWKFLFDVGTQLVPPLFIVEYDQPHFFSRILVDAKRRTLTIILCLDGLVIVYHQFVVFQLEFDVCSIRDIIPKSMIILGSKFRSKIVVDASLLKKRDHGTHESNTRHISEHLVEIVHVKHSTSNGMGVYSIYAYPFHLEQYGRVVR